MTKFVIKKFIKNYENTGDEKVRESYGVLAGILGIICNAILVGIKLSIGTVMGSIAIISDGLNNLSDTGSSLVSVIGAKLSNKKPDRDHPFGHGRLEYVAALIVSFIIIFVGIETITSSFEKILNPSQVKFNYVMIIILTLSCLIKLWMYSYNKYMGEKIDSEILRAASADSLSDSVATFAVIVATVIGKFTGSFPMDGCLGILVSFLILKAGYQVAKDTITLLLGKPPAPELVEKIRNTILAERDIIGVHDLIVHDYGPGRVIASAHAEVPDDGDVTAIHEIIDGLEKRVAKELGLLLVIHMDPIAVNCPKTNQLKKMVEDIVDAEDKRFSIHDFRITDGEENINLIFDLVLPIEFSEKEREDTADKIARLIKIADKRCSCVIETDVI